VRLTTAAAWDESPRLSPDGRRVLFVRRSATGTSDGRLWVMNADGSDAHPLFAAAARDALPGEDVEPAWSPDGRRVAFASSRGGGGAYLLWTTDADGGNARALAVTDTLAWRVLRAPSWSPDGLRLAAAGSYDSAGTAVSALATVTVATGRAALLVRHAGASVGAPAYAPDGRTVLFHSTRDGRPQLYAAAAAGGAAGTRIVTSDSRDASGVWSPDGRQLAFVRRTDLTPGRVYLAPADGGAARPLTAGARYVDFAVDWR
jgi:TolB protein